MIRIRLASISKLQFLAGVKRYYMNVRMRNIKAVYHQCNPKWPQCFPQMS